MDKTAAAVHISQDRGSFQIFVVGRLTLVLSILTQDYEGVSLHRGHRVALFDVDVPCDCLCSTEHKGQCQTVPSCQGLLFFLRGTFAILPIPLVLFLEFVVKP